MVGTGLKYLPLLAVMRWLMQNSVKTDAGR